MDLEKLKIDRGESRPRPARRRVRGLGWIVFLAILAGVAFVFRSPIARAVDRLRLPAVKITKVVKTSPLAASAVSGTVANGYVIASRKAALSADTPGRIVEMNVAEGSVVKKGQVLARLYSDEYAAALRHAQADVESAKSSVAAAQARVAARRADLERLKANVAQSDAALVDAQAATRLAQVKLDRAVKMLAEHISTQQDLDDAQATFDRAKAVENSAAAIVRSSRAALAQGESEVLASEAAAAESQSRIPVLTAARDQAQATLDKTEVRAPFDGIVVLKDAEVGEVVSPNSQGGNSRGSVATMVDWSSLEVEVELPETSLTAAKVGENANIYLDAYPERLYSGKVQRIWPTANRQKATVEVRVAFDAPDEKLRPEMGARVVFSPAKPKDAASGAPPESSILIPQSAVVRSEGKSGVFVLERDVVRFRALELGDSRVDRVLVKSGLEGGESLVDDPPPSLADGDRVRIQENS